MNRAEQTEVADVLTRERDLCAAAENAEADRRLRAWRADPWAMACLGVVPGWPAVGEPG